MAQIPLPVPYFISFTRLDKKLPRQLIELLSPHFAISRRFEFKSWRDVGILPGEDWDAEIHQAMEECTFALLLLSPGYFSRPYIVREELPRLLAKDKIVIPVLMKPVDHERQNTQGLDRLQNYRLNTPSGPRSFSECTSSLQRDQFALNLYQKIEQRLEKVLGRNP